MSNQNTIEIKNLTKKYNGQTVVKNVSFAVRKGTICGFIGPNGAGKTTTLSCLMNLVIPDSGNMYIESRKVGTDPYFNEHVGFVPAEPKFPEMRVKEYIDFCAEMRDVPSEKVEKKFFVSSLKDFADKKCSQLSTGWKKSLQIFILTLYEVKIFLLDEVQNGLDPIGRTLLFENLQKARDEGKTILLSTHILSDLEKLADDIVMIKKGEIVYNGANTGNIEKTFEELFVKEERAKRNFAF